MKIITKSLILIALAMSIFTGCSGGGGSSSPNQDEINASTSYILNSLENRDVPSTASLLAQSEDTKVKITRDVESDMMNVDVLSGSVEVTEVVAPYKVF